MNKITKTKINAISSKHSRLKECLSQYNDLVKQLEDILKSEVQRFDEGNADILQALDSEITDLTCDLSGLAEDEHKKMESYMQGRRNSWHDSNAGVRFTNWADGWANYAHDVNSMFINVDFEVEFERADLIEMPSIER